MPGGARASNWDALTELQQVYTAEVERLRAAGHSKPFSDNERLRRFQLLERILSFDARSATSLRHAWRTLWRC